MVLDMKQAAMVAALKKVAEAQPEHLPQIVVHSDLSWLTTGKCDAFVADTDGRLHMCETDFRSLKNYGAPTKLVKDYVGLGVSVHEFDVEKMKVDASADPSIKKKKKVAVIMEKYGSDILAEEKGDV